ncbi:MAG TPA: hypothetical protein VHD36_06345 [Pirellulales bacterium]|nr:hypothetical protein [Pirellulales bacterium]
MTLEELQREVDDLPFRSYVTTYSFMSAMSVAAIALFALIPWDAAAVAQIRFNIERTETWLRAVADREELESLYTLQSQVRDRESLIAYLTRHNELAMQFRLPRMDMAWVGATSSSPIAGKLEDRDDRVEID